MLPTPFERAGASRTFPWEISWFAVQAANVWVAFLCLPFSNNLAGGVTARSTQGRMLHGEGDYRTLRAVTRSREPRGLFFRAFACVVPGGDFSRGGVLHPWIVYDLRCVSACLLWAAADAWRHGVGTEAFGAEAWQFRATLWWCKTLYGLLSMPFVIFLLPGLGNALTHARPTGYNRSGKCTRRLTVNERRQLKRSRRARTSEAEGAACRSPSTGPDSPYFRWPSTPPPRAAASPGQGEDDAGHGQQDDGERV